MTTERLQTAPPEVTATLHELCQWAILGTVHDIAQEVEESSQAMDSDAGRDYGYLFVEEEGWDTTLRDVHANRWHDSMRGYSSRTLSLAHAYGEWEFDSTSFIARTRVHPESELHRGDTILHGWPGTFADTPMVCADQHHLVNDLWYSRTPTDLIKVVTGHDPQVDMRLEIARFRTTREVTTEQGLARVVKLGKALLRKLPISE